MVTGTECIKIRTRKNRQLNYERIDIYHLLAAAVAVAFAIYQVLTGTFRETARASYSRVRFLVNSTRVSFTDYDPKQWHVCTVYYFI